MMLLEWMMEFADEFLFKRQTYALSVSYVDLYLSQQRNLAVKPLVTIRMLRVSL